MLLNKIKKNSVLLTVLVLVLIGLGSIMYSYQKKSQKDNQINKTIKEDQIPQARLDKTKFDWGTIGNKKPVIHEFTLSNQGLGKLLVQNIATSCGCTTARVKKNDGRKKTPYYIQPGEQAKIVVKFDPQVMSSIGKVKRAVRITTNDPNKRFLIINLKANVKSS